MRRSRIGIGRGSEPDISGSESNRGGCSRRPRATLSDSRALWLTDPLGLAAGLLSGCLQRESESCPSIRRLNNSRFSVTIQRDMGESWLAPST